MRKLCRPLVLVATLCCWAMTTLAQGNIPKLVSTEHSQALAYSKAFAERFALPEPSPDLELTGGLSAMQVRLEIDSKAYATYRCKLKFYFDNSLPIAYPTDGISSSRAVVTQQEHFIFDGNTNNRRWLALSVQDRLHFSAQDDFGRYAGIASPDLQMPAKGYWAQMDYDAFHRELFPGVGYIRFDSDCHAFATAERRDLQLWVKRAGGKDYRRFVTIDPNDFLKFTIPPALFDLTREWARRADAENRAKFKVRKK